MSTSWRRPRVALALSLGLMALLALPRFGRSLWIDEASSLWFARYSWAGLLLELCDPHPPAFYALLKAWRVVGDGEFWLRLLPLLGALLAVGLTYRLGSMLCGRRCAWLAALLIALHPLQVWYAGELRMYTWAQALGLLAFLLGLRLLRADHWPRRLPLAYGLAALLALFSDYSALLALGLLQLLALSLGRLGQRRWLALQAAVAAPFTLWWLLAPQQIALSRSYQPVFLAVQLSRFGLEITPAQGAVLLQGVFVLLALASILATWLWGRRRQGIAAHPAWGYGLVLAWLALLLFVAAPRLYSLKRLLVVGLPYFALLLAMVLARRPRWLALGLLALTLAASVWVVFEHGRDPWRQVIQGLDRAEAAWVDELAVPVWAYYNGADGEPWTWAPLYGDRLPSLPDLQPAPGDELLIVVAESPYRNLALLLPPSFSAAYALEEEQHEIGIGVYRYRRRLSPLADAGPTVAPSSPAQWGLQLPSPLDTCRSRAPAP